ncbi:MAG: hypothetical protein GKR88_07115 [Flavobacteriaceae bacterium]|nr:MAG: hypothetical protein GKR88_07115 [Flavobacteriaceae bacterium]
MRDFSLLKQRIIQYIDYKKVSKYEFYQKTGISNGVLSQKTGISEENTLKFLKYYSEINPEWLLTGKDPMLKSEVQTKVIDKRPIIEITPDSQKLNTLVADVSASAGFGAMLDNPKKLQELPAISLPNAPFGLNVAFQIQGDSMHPTIRHADYVAANHLNDINTIIDGYTYILLDKDHGVLCKRIYREHDRIKVVSDNPSYPPYYRSGKDILAFFKCFMRLSTDFRTYHNDVRNAIQDLHMEVRQLKKRIEK